MTASIRLLLLFASSALMLTGCGAAPQAGPADKTPPGEAAPAAPASTSAEEKLPRIMPVTAEQLAALLEHARGKTVVVNLWATWCPPCVAEMPHFIQFYEELDPAKVAFLSISADDIATVDTKIRDFAKEKEIPFPIRVINDELDKIMAALGAELSGALPATLVLDPEGKVAQLWERQVTIEDLRRATSVKAPVDTRKKAPEAPASPAAQEVPAQ